MNTQTDWQPAILANVAKVLEVHPLIPQRMLDQWQKVQGEKVWIRPMSLGRLHELELVTQLASLRSRGCTATDFVEVRFEEAHALRVKAGRPATEPLVILSCIDLVITD